MSGTSLTPDAVEREASVLDHAQEFVELVSANSAGEYAALLASGRFDHELAGPSGFNHGKLYAYAEFNVFRREFLQRFPEASLGACINAFSGLFLKNDISLSNLLEFVEGENRPDHREMEPHKRLRS